MLSVLFAAVVVAQAAPVADPPVVIAPPVEAVPVASCCTVKALTPVRIAITAPLASNGAATGQMFAFTLAEPILLDGGRSIPAGTPGQGEIVHAARSGMAGKAGELVLAARYLDYQGIRIPMRSLRFGGAGKDQTGLAFAATTAIGLIGMVITGGEVRIPAGAIAEAKISVDTQIDASRLAAPAQGPAIEPASPPALPSAPVVTTASTSEGTIQ